MDETSKQLITETRAPLNTRTKASLYEAFPATEARRLAERLEWNYALHIRMGQIE